jgi:hypothetical protein
MKKFLYKVPTWTKLKGLGTSKAVRSSYFWIIIVPVVSKFFSSLNDVVEVNLLGAVWALDTSLPFSLGMFYFSAVSFAVGSLIYTTFCPMGLDKYNSFEEYKEKGKSLESLISSMWLACVSTKFNWPFDTKPEQLRRFIRDFTNYDGEIRNLDLTPGPQIKIVNSGIKTDREKAAYFMVIDRWNHTSPIIRLVCWLCYGIGMIFFGIVLLENFTYVVRFI